MAASTSAPEAQHAVVQVGGEALADDPHVVEPVVVARVRIDDRAVQVDLALGTLGQVDAQLGERRGRVGAAGDEDPGRGHRGVGHGRVGVVADHVGEAGVADVALLRGGEGDLVAVDGGRAVPHPDHLEQVQPLAFGVLVVGQDVDADRLAGADLDVGVEAADRRLVGVGSTRGTITAARAVSVPSDTT